MDGPGDGAGHGSCRIKKKRRSLSRRRDLLRRRRAELAIDPREMTRGRWAQRGGLVTAKVTSLVYTPGRGPGVRTVPGNADFAREQPRELHASVSSVAYLGPRFEDRV